MILRSTIVCISLLLLWQFIILIFHIPSYILPGPYLVWQAFIKNGYILAIQTWPTVIETLLGFLLGSLVGVFVALLLIWIKPLRYWLLPILIISQAIPTFAIAPLLVIWFGYGLASKIITTMIMIFFPVTSYFYDGLRRIPPEWLDMANIMKGKSWQILWRIRIPAALPALASGLRVAAVFAPIGAIVGEWVGASQGLGFLMLNANARLQLDMMFAALLIIIVFALLLYFIVDRVLHKLIFWH